MVLQTKHKIFLASLAFRVVRLARKIVGKDVHGQFQRSSFTWELDLREVVDFMIYLSGGFESYLSQFIRQNVKDGDVVMDIGANIGAHTLTMGQSVSPSGKAYAIEATEYAFNKLQRNIELNPTIADQIHPFHCVLRAPEGEEGSSIAGSIHSSWPFDSTDERHPSHQGVLKTLGNAQHSTLDALVEANKIDRLDLVKIDVDGHEWDVLSGGRNTFSTLRPTILMELAPDYNETEHARAFENIHQLLIDIGYTFYDFKGQQLPIEAAKLAATIQAGASRNVVVVPDTTRKIAYL
ncbi:MAG: FkbM family methyltransferase [Opitutales bacterium]|nr:FkbM family methyltransferase [Opitutales bacterium]